MKSPDEALKAMLSEALDGGRGWAYQGSSSDERITLTKEEGKALVELGLVEHITNGTAHYKLTPQGIRKAVELTPSYKRIDISALLEETLDLAYFHPENGETAIPAIWDRGSDDTRLVLVLGSNAGGKSFFRRLIQLMTHKGVRHEGRWKGGKYLKGPWKVKPGPFPVSEIIHISMQGRTQGGFVGAAIYGTEEWRSTGENSAHTVSKGVETVQGRSHTAIIYWDEPDIGMSAASAAGAGLEIKELLDDPSPLMQAVFVTSHSPALVAQLVEHNPHYVYLGDEKGPATLNDWLDEQQNPTPVRPSDLAKIANRRFKLIQAILNRNKR